MKNNQLTIVVVLSFLLSLASCNTQEEACTYYYPGDEREITFYEEEIYKVYYKESTNNDFTLIFEKEIELETNIYFSDLQNAGILELYCNNEEVIQSCHLGALAPFVGGCYHEILKVPPNASFKFVFSSIKEKDSYGICLKKDYDYNDYVNEIHKPRELIQVLLK